MSNVKKVLQMTSLLFGMVILFCYIAWNLGYEGFIIIGHINIPEWTWYVIPPIFLCVNLSLLTGFTLNMYSWKVLYFSLPLSLISAIGAIWLPFEIFTGPLPTLVLLIAILLMQKGRWAFFRLVIATGVTLAHQYIISKISIIDLQAELSMYQVLRLSINAILLMLLLFSIGGEKYYGKKRLELLVFPGRIRDASPSDEGNSSNPQSPSDLPVDKFEQLVMGSVIIVVQIIQWVFILWVCNLDFYFLDALVMTTSFICHGMIIMKRKHLKPIIICTLAATAMFYFAARFTISFQYSQFFPIFIGLLLVYTIYRISYQFEKAATDKARKELEKVLNLEGQLDEAWKHIDKLY